MLTPETPPAVRLQHVDKTYAAGTPAEVQALRDVSLQINQGEFVAIVGPSGSGKSTLMNLIGCLDTPSAGRCEVAGSDISQLDAAELARLRLRHVGFVFQSFQLLSRMTALQNVMMPLAYAGVPRDQRVVRARQVLDRVGLNDRWNHRPSEMSGGQQQRVAIARALINEPSIVLADEPTGALDSHTGEDVLRLFAELHKAGRTIVLITHDRDVASSADRECLIADGVLTESRGIAVGVMP